MPFNDRGSVFPGVFIGRHGMGAAPSNVNAHVVYYFIQQHVSTKAVKAIGIRAALLYRVVNITIVGINYYITVRKLSCGFLYCLTKSTNFSG